MTLRLDELLAAGARIPRVEIKSSQGVMDYFAKNIAKADAEIGGSLGGVKVVVNKYLPPGWMVLETKRGTDVTHRYFKLADDGLVEMVPPADFGATI